MEFKIRICGRLLRWLLAKYGQEQGDVGGDATLRDQEVKATP